MAGSLTEYSGPATRPGGS
ncbi:hypothetical protein EYZ11_013316 [Aspergillus tanneri]|uniref:Uncharacterized protein n=1 Tax=Aspergillus tanneri TaxID=1220188 RepID=A0A4S3J064_9EURO|nr:hypothetical protein EYZ11_013316 [Aspergillus tanneri]